MIGGLEIWQHVFVSNGGTLEVSVNCEERVVKSGRRLSFTVLPAFVLTPYGVASTVLLRALVRKHTLMFGKAPWGSEYASLCAHLRVSSLLTQDL